MERRSFLKWATNLLGALFGAVLGIPAVGYLLDPRNRPAPAGDFKLAGRLNDLKPGVPQQVVIRNVRRDDLAHRPRLHEPRGRVHSVGKPRAALCGKRGRAGVRGAGGAVQPRRLRAGARGGPDFEFRRGLLRQPRPAGASETSCIDRSSFRRAGPILAYRGRSRNPATNGNHPCSSSLACWSYSAA